MHLECLAQRVTDILDLRFGELHGQDRFVCCSCNFPLTREMEEV